MPVILWTSPSGAITTVAGAFQCDAVSNGYNVLNVNTVAIRGGQHSLDTDLGP